MVSTITESGREHYDRIEGISEAAPDMACSYPRDRFNIIRLVYGRRGHERTSSVLGRVERAGSRGARHGVSAVAVRGEGRLFSRVECARSSRTDPVASAGRTAYLDAPASAGRRYRPYSRST